MADFYIGGSAYGAIFASSADGGIRPSFEPRIFATWPVGEVPGDFPIYTDADPITVGTVGRNYYNEQWNFGDSPQTIIRTEDRFSFLKSELLAAGFCPFTVEGESFEWFEKKFSRFTNDFKVKMPEASAVLSKDVREIITDFTVDASVRPPVVTSVTKERAAVVSVSVSKIGNGEFLPYPFDDPTATPRHVADVDGAVYGTVTFSKLYNVGFSYNTRTGRTNVVPLRDFTRKFSFNIGEPPSF